MSGSNDARLDDVMRALADPTRRRILRTLVANPGLTTSELAASVPGMTRWGVMKHLGVMRAAGLVHSFHEGRRRRHYEDRGALRELDSWLREALTPNS